MAEAFGTLYLLSLLGQLVFTGDDLHCICLSIALVLDERNWTVGSHLPCKTESIIIQLCRVV